MPIPDMRASGFKLETPDDFHYSRCLDYLKRSPLECTYAIEDGVIRKAIRTAHGVRILSLSCGDGSDSSPLLFSLRAAEDGASGEGSGEEEAAHHVREWFDFDRDLQPFYLMAERSPLLGPVVRAHRGLRLIGVPDLFEALCWAIAGQQVNLAFAYTLKRRLVEAYGERAEQDGRTFRLFPEPSRIAATSRDELCGLQFTRAKADALLAVADRMASGELSRGGLLALGDFDEAERVLRQIRGIGPWTAHYVRMRCLRDPRACPLGDVGLQNAVRSLLGLDRKPTEAELRALFAEWSGWEAYATFYLWRCLY